MRTIIILLLSHLILFIPAIATAQDTPATEPAAVTPPPPGSTFTDGYQNGGNLAVKYSTYDTWFGGSLIMGLAGGFIGAGLMAGMCQIGTAKPPAAELEKIQDQSEPFRNGFRQGYDGRMKRMALRSIFVGGLIGTAVSVGLMISNNK